MEEILRLHAQDDIAASGGSAISANIMLFLGNCL
jgi:hypothetical protein